MQSRPAISREALFAISRNALHTIFFGIEQQDRITLAQGEIAGAIGSKSDRTRPMYRRALNR